ncbi:MAG: type II toxin-antitoxin system VapC family toxin [Planctomycetota bacterium]
MIVLDASAAVELILGTPNGRRVAERIADPRRSLHAPHLLDVEVAQVLRRYERSRVVDAERATAALRDLGQLGIRAHEHAILLPRVWELRANLTAYDAVYVALAEGLDAPLLTLDTRLASAPGHRARIEVLAP